MELLPNRSISSGVDGQDRIGRGLPSGPIQQWGDESIQIVGARTMLTSMIIWINGAKLRPRGSTQRLWCKWPQRYVHVRPVGEENKIVLHFIPKGGPLSLPHYMSISRWWQKAVESLMSINVLVLSPIPRQDCSLADGQDPPPATTTANQFAPGVMIVSETSGSRGHSGLQSKHGRSRRTCLQNLRDNAANERG